MKVTVSTTEANKAKPTFNGAQIGNRPGIYVRQDITNPDYFIVILNDYDKTKLFIKPNAVGCPLQFAMSHHFQASKFYVEADETVSLTFQN